MEKKVLLKELVDSGTNIRREFIPKAVVSDKGKYQIGEFWDANKTIDVIVNNSHQQHDNIRELDEFAHNLDDIKVGRISVDNVTELTESNIDNLKIGDTVIDSTNGESYTVANKSDNELSIVYSDPTIIKEILYQKENDEWSYIQTNAFDPATKQDLLVSGTNIKTINGYSILGSGNIVISGIQSFPYTWDTTHTMMHLVTSINHDSSATPGKVYLGTMRMANTPSELVGASLKVEILDIDNNTGFKTILFTAITKLPTYIYRCFAYSLGNTGIVTSWQSWMLSDGTYTKSEIDLMIQNAGGSAANETPHLFMTLAEYEAIQNINPDAIYFILEPEPGAGFPLLFPITLA